MTATAEFLISVLVISAIQVTLLLGITWLVLPRLFADAPSQRRRLVLVVIGLTMICLPTSAAARKCGFQLWVVPSSPIAIQAQVDESPAAESTDCCDHETAAAIGAEQADAEFEVQLAPVSAIEPLIALDPMILEDHPRQRREGESHGAIAFSWLPRLFETVRPWAIGALLMWAVVTGLLGLRLIKGLWMVRSIRRSASKVTKPSWLQQNEEVATMLGLRHTPCLCFSSRVTSPIVLGIWSPLVVLPKSLQSALAGEELRQILLHEHTHIRNRDNLIGLLVRLWTMLFWPHPLVHFVRKQFYHACEQACDHMVAIHDDNVAYCRTLLRIGMQKPQQPLPLVTGVASGRWNLEHRISRVLNIRKESMKDRSWCLGAWSFGLVLLVIMSGGIQLFPITAQAQARLVLVEPEEEKQSARLVEISRVMAVLESAERGEDKKRFDALTDLALALRDGNQHRIVNNLIVGQLIEEGADSVKPLMKAIHSRKFSGRGYAGWALANVLTYSGAESDEAMKLLDELADDEDSYVRTLTRSGLSEMKSAPMRAGGGFEGTPDHSDELEGDQARAFSRHKLMGPITSGGPARALDPPSDAEIMRVFRRARGLEKQGDRLMDNVRIVKEKIADYVDPPQIVPLIGPARLHHSHYKITIHFDHPNQVNDDAVEVIYIDHNHFHVVDEAK